MPARLLRTCLLVPLALALLPACAARVEKLVRTRAAGDFSCPETDLKVTQVDGSSFRQEASGCGRSDTYTANCNLFGMCRVQSSAEIAAREAELDRQRAEMAAARAAAPPPSPRPDAHAPQAPAPKPEQRPASLPSNCSFASDCDPGVKCNSGRCANTEGSACGFDSDCGGNGAKCGTGNKCSTAPDGKCNYASECPGGTCSSGKCKFK